MSASVGARLRAPVRWLSGLVSRTLARPQHVQEVSSVPVEPGAR
jgi:hypothetical protein